MRALLAAVLLVSLITGVLADPPPVVPTLITYRKELALTDQQVQGIEKIVEEFRQQAGALKTQVEAAQAQLNAALAAHADLPQLKERLKACYDTRFQLHYADLATGRRLEQLLSKAQLESWRRLQAQARKSSQPQRP